jgi:ABC-2 type transport system ATP-binding protein
VPAVPVPAVSVRGLTIRYGPPGSPPAVDGLDLEAHGGEVLAVLGPNGAGKTSTIEAMEGYRRPTAGTISVLGLDPRTDHRKLVPRLGVMLQDGGVYPMLGPRAALDLFARYYADPRPPEELLDLVSLRGVAATPWRRLSGGERQRLSLALALIGRPEVAFLDEPTAGVDPEGRITIRTVVADLRAAGVAVVLTTHELTEAEKMADRIAILSAGRVVRAGTPQELAAAGGPPGLSFGAAPGLDTAALAASLGTGAEVAEESTGRYRVRGVSGPTAVAALTAWLAGRDIALSDLTTGRSLEDVYFEAVGAAAVRTDDEAGGVTRAGWRDGRGRQRGGRRRGGSTS